MLFIMKGINRFFCRIDLWKKIIQEFLPNQLTDEEIHIEISKIIDAHEQFTIKDMGKIMGQLKEKFSGRMDFGKASGIVKALLK